MCESSDLTKDIQKEWRDILNDVSEDSIKRKFLLEKAIDSYNRELDLLWKRSQFFWLFIAAAFLAFTRLESSESLERLAVSCVGLVASLSWSVLNRGSKFWYESWETKILADETLEKWFMPAQKQPNKGFVFSAREFSPSKVNIAISDYFTLFWMIITLSLFINCQIFENFTLVEILLGLLTFSYLLILLLCVKRTKTEVK